MIAHRSLSLFELLIAIGVLVSGAVAVLAVVPHAAASVLIDERRRVAAEAAEARLEAMRTLEPSEIVRAWRTPGGETFVPEGLPEGQGELVLHLDEEEQAPRLGLPRDLDGDGLSETTDVGEGALLLPVEVLITWVGPGGRETYRLETYVAKKEVQ